ncbi:MAG: glycosyltransferase [Anaerolineales bacterium]|nr:glycosyltransferase [Anaerolineales bacterium]
MPEHASSVKEALTFCEHVIPLPANWQPHLPESGWRNLLMRVLAHLHWPRLFEFVFGYVHGPSLYWIPPNAERTALLEHVCSSRSFDVVICETMSTVELAPGTCQAPKVVSLYDIQSEVFRRMRRVDPGALEDRLFFLPELLRLRRYEAFHYRQFDAAITVSSHDKGLLRHMCPQLPSDVVENGVDTQSLQPVGGGEDDGCLAFVASYNYAPNKDAATYFCEYILPLIRAEYSGATLLAVGRDAPAELARYSGVEVIGTVPDVKPYLVQASVVVVPLRAGGGTRIKILEAMSMGKAIVSTTIGAEGLNVEQGKHLLIADGAADFAKAVVSLLRDKPRREALGREGRRLVEAKYSWDLQAERLERMLLVLANTGCGTPQQTTLPPNGADTAAQQILS